jgi:N-acyl-L-homoserine lactone synthetase
MKIVKVDPRNHRDLFQKVLRLRYEVYCLERGFEKVTDHPQGLESDPYDENAIHLAAICERSQEVVGTVRLIMHSDLGFPLEKIFEVDLAGGSVCKSRIGEISRLSVPRKHRDNFTIVKKLFQGIAIESRDLGLTHWCAAMAKGLPVLLKRKKIYFQQIGPEIEYHGPRAPFFGPIFDIARENEDFCLYEAGTQQAAQAVAH